MHGVLPPLALWGVMTLGLNTGTDLPILSTQNCHSQNDIFITKIIVVIHAAELNVTLSV
jgi:hypothetical protein